MKFKIDEKLPNELAADLRDLGHEAATVFDEGLVGAKDPVLMAAVASENKILLTLDKGIANLQQYPAEQYSGVVLFRTVKSGRRAILAFIRERFPDLLELDLRGRLTVVGPTRRCPGLSEKLRAAVRSHLTPPPAGWLAATHRGSL